MKTIHVIKILAILTICGVVALSGCMSSPLDDFEDVEIGCLEYANATCLKAMSKGYPSGVVTCILLRTRDRHAVTWIYVDGKTLYRDNAFGCWRTKEELGIIISQTEGISAGVFDIVPIPRIKKLK